MRGFLEGAGVVSASYRRVAPFHSQLDASAALYNFGFPASWVALYDEDPAFREHDPIADFIIRAGRFMTWHEAIEAQQLTAPQEAFVAAMHAHGVIDGIALPLFGPRGREAYTTYSFGREIGAGDLNTILMLNDFFQLRHTEIANSEDYSWSELHALSDRETEVLFWIAKGKSNKDISVILGVTAATVAEYVKRIFLKLGVYSRMDAARVGLQRGIVSLTGPV